MAYIKVNNRVVTFVKYINKIKNRNRQKRGKITSFSRKSFKRLKKLVLSLTCEPALFVTLTYPLKFPDPHTSKRHLHNMLKLIHYHFPEACGIWKLEPQKRGAPHYHLLVWNINLDSSQAFESFKNFISRAWFKIVASTDEKHLLAGTQVVNLNYLKKKDKNVDFLSIYLSKYFSKEITTNEDWEFPGRFWGILNREELKKMISEEKKIFINDKLFYFIRRILRNRVNSFLRKKGQKFKGFRYNFIYIFKDEWKFFEFFRDILKLYPSNFVYEGHLIEII